MKCNIAQKYLSQNLIIKQIVQSWKFIKNIIDSH